MTDSHASPILVLAESTDERRDRITEELISVAQRIASRWDVDIHAAVFGADAEARAIAIAGFDRVTSVAHADHAVLAPFTAEPWIDFTEVAARSSQPSVILIPATLAGRDIAPRLAARLDIPVASDVVSVTAEDQGRIECRRQVRGGRLISDVTIPAGQAVISIRPQSIREPAMTGGSGVISLLELPQSVRTYGVEVIESIVAEKSAVGLNVATRIVSGGRGLGKPENFTLVEDLAAVLNAAVGASGAVVGAGWRPHAQQVGSTGTTVTPRLYLAVGISGAVQHTIGMSGSDAIVAINRDPDAPIFQIASLGVVGDLFEIVPALIEELKKST